jgi:hypothetical protein
MMHHFNSLRYWLLPYVTDTEDSTRTFAPSNTITALLEISPRLNSVNAWIRTPSMKTDFSSIPVNPLVTEGLRFNPAVSYARRIRGECELSWVQFSPVDAIMPVSLLSSLPSLCPLRCSDPHLACRASRHSDVIIITTLGLPLWNCHPFVLPDLSSEQVVVRCHEHVLFRQTIHCLEAKL